MIVLNFFPRTFYKPGLFLRDLSKFIQNVGTNKNIFQRPSKNIVSAKKIIFHRPSKDAGSAKKVFVKGLLKTWAQQKKSIFSRVFHKLGFIDKECQS